MKMDTTVALVTGATDGIGQALAIELAQQKITALAVIDFTSQVNDVAQEANAIAGRAVATPYCGDFTDARFRASVVQDFSKKHGPVTLCVPLPGGGTVVTVKAPDTENQTAVFPDEQYAQIVENHLLTPIHWASEAVAELRRAEKPSPAMIVFLGSIDSRGNCGEVDRAASKLGLNKAAANLISDARLCDVRFGVIHPVYINSPFTQALGSAHLIDREIPNTQERRLIQPEEVADAICQRVSEEYCVGVEFTF